MELPRNSCYPHLQSFALDMYRSTPLTSSKMASLINIAAVLLSTTIGCALAVPASSNNGRSFTLPAIYNENFTRDFAADLRNTRLKDRKNADSALRKRQDSSSPANYRSGIYVTPVTLGGNQVLNIHFDTGSADL